MMDYTDDAQAVTGNFPDTDIPRMPARSATADALPAAPPVGSSRPRRDTTGTAHQTAELSTIEQRLDSFIGLHSDEYLEYYQELYQKKSAGALGHWHWVPFAFSISWLFARRRYLTGLALLLLTLGLHVLLPGGPGIALGIAVIALGCGFAGRPLYVALALRKIEQIEARRLWPVQRDTQLHRAGGVSIIGAAFGTILWVCTMAAPYLLQWIP